MAEIKQRGMQLGVGLGQLESGKGNGVKIYFGGGNAFNVGGERKRLVKDDSLVSSLSHEGMMAPLSVIKKTEERQAEGEFSLLDMSIEMPVRHPNGCVKWAIG